MGFETEKFVSPVDEDFICSICHLVLEDPVRIAGCEHMFCRLCINEWIKKNTICPADRKTIHVKDLIAPDRTVVNMMNKLKIKCKFESLGCCNVIRLESLKSHLNVCDFDPKIKWPCVGCRKEMTRQDMVSMVRHRCVEKLEIITNTLRQENDKQKFLLEDNQSAIKKLKEDNQKLKQELDKQNNLVKVLIQENNENQKKFKILLSENNSLKLSSSTSLSRNIPPFINTNLVVNPKPSASTSSITTSGNCIFNKLDNKLTTSSIDKWPILNKLQSNLKSRVKLASVLSTGLNSDAMIITNNDEAFWITSNQSLLVKEKNNVGPIKIEGLSGLKIKSLEYGGGTGSAFYLMVLTEVGRLLSWSYTGHLLGTNGTKSKKNNLTPTVVNNLINKNVIQVSCGDRHVLALTSDGIVYTWGDNQSGQVGEETNYYRNQPIKVTEGIRSQKTVAVACCSDSSFALMDNGDVFVWGDNRFGQLGLGNNTNQKKPTRIEALVGIKVLRVSCGDNHVLAVADEGSLFAWGNNCNGQLGTGDKENRNKPVKVGPFCVKFIEVAATCNSFNHLSVALSEDGRCWIWGRCTTEYTTMTENVLSPKPVKSKSINDAIAEYAIYQTTWKTIVMNLQ